MIIRLFISEFNFLVFEEVSVLMSCFGLEKFFIRVVLWFDLGFRV